MFTLPDSATVLSESAQTMLWQAGEITDENGEFTGESYDEIWGNEPLFPTTAAEILRDVYGFIASVAPADLHEYLTEQGWEQFIHDYWLTRNRHGAGFWDRGLGDLGDRLTELAHNDGEYHVWDSTLEDIQHVDGFVGWFYE